MEVDPIACGGLLTRVVHVCRQRRRAAPLLRGATIRPRVTSSLRCNIWLETLPNATPLPHAVVVDWTGF
jgi:hypothetical protein